MASRRLSSLASSGRRSAGPFNVTLDASVLRGVLGPIRLVPVVPEVGRPYYQAETALQVLDLVEAPEGGSNWLRWWRRWESNPRPETLSSGHLHP